MSLIRCACSLWLAATLFATSAASQTASYTFFGKGCTILGQEVVPFRVAGVPRLGSSFAINTFIGGTYNQLGAVFTGTSKTRFGSWNLPKSIPGFCGPLLCSPDLLTPVPYKGRPTFYIPNDRRLLGTVLYQQVLMMLHPYARPPSRRLMLSRGGRALIGR